MAEYSVLDLNHRARELIATLDEMTSFDLNTADQERCVRWLELRKIYAEQLRTFVLMVSRDRRELLNEIDSILKDH